MSYHYPTNAATGVGAGSVLTAGQGWQAFPTTASPSISTTTPSLSYNPSSDIFEIRRIALQMAIDFGQDRLPIGKILGLAKQFEEYMFLGKTITNDRAEAEEASRQTEEGEASGRDLLGDKISAGDFWKEYGTTYSCP